MIKSVLEKRNEKDRKGKQVTITYKTVNNILKNIKENQKKL